jgi:predicted membrane protein
LFSWGSEEVRYDIRLSEDTPLELELHTGASNTDISLTALNLKKVVMNTGVGDTELDLNGHYEESFDVHLNVGVGNTKIDLPNTIGVKVELTSGIGDVNVRGLSQQGNAYVNDMYNESEVNVVLKIEQGVGNVELVLAD